MSRYSQVNYPYFKLLKKKFKKNPEWFKSAKRLYIDRMQETGILNTEFYEMAMIENILRKEYHNFYIEDKKLSDFLIETKIKDQSIEYFTNSIQSLSKNIGNYIGSSIEVTNSNGVKNEITDGSILTGKIYNKSMSRTLFFEFVCFKDSSKLDIIGIISNGRDPNDNIERIRCGSVVSDGETNKSFFYVKSNGENIELTKMINMVTNLIFYINAFPDKILNTPPNDMCDKLNKNNSTTIKTHEKISNYLRDVEPHLRRGHFRYLGSDFYKDKKGQTVFVNPSFVGGKSKTIVK